MLFQELDINRLRAPKYIVDVRLGLDSLKRAYTACALQC